MDVADRLRGVVNVLRGLTKSVRTRITLWLFHEPAEVALIRRLEDLEVALAAAEDAVEAARAVADRAY
jgi:hypothetical protein